MDRIGVRELRQNASHYLDRVKTGERLAVTEWGRLVAMLVPAHPADQARERLIGSGHLIPAAQRPLHLPTRVAARPDEPTSGEALEEMRRERL